MLENERADKAKYWLKKIQDLPATKNVKILNVCGGHERSITNAGLRQLLPDHIELIPGPGCPVCVCPEEDIFDVIDLALNEDVTVVAFGDMLRVPVNKPKSEPRTLEQAKAAGADIRAVASPTEAVDLARQLDRPVVFFAAGFETTTAPIAAMLAQGVPDNLFVYLSARLTWPAVEMLLSNPTSAGFQCIIAPGHVATIMGADEWSFVADKHQMPAAVAGFEADSLLAATYSVLRQLSEKRHFLDNCYAESVNPHGNKVAQKILSEVLHVVDANWRGIGIIPNSGFAINSTFASRDARQLDFFADRIADPTRRRIGEMPPGCDCARVVLGQIYPNQCKLYGVACNPRHPIGPCMVSDEGACRIWWAAGVTPPALEDTIEVST